MNRTEVQRFTTYVQNNRVRLLQLLATGEGRSDETKEDNYRTMQQLLLDRGMRNVAAEVEQAATIFQTVTGRVLQCQAPPPDNGAARALLVLNRDSTDVRVTIRGVDVRLDIDQNKHQHPSQPIGTRQKGGGNRFIATCDRNWHINTTLAHMAEWADGLAGMQNGQRRFHGQAEPVDGIHYEGFCLMANGQKYVLFHCYPANNSPLLMR